MTPHTQRATAPPDESYLTTLLETGLLIPSGVPGVYGLSGEFEHVIEHFERIVTRAGSDLGAEVMRFPPLISRRTYRKTDHLEAFPNLMGSVHSFTGGGTEHRELVRKGRADEDWSGDLHPTDVMLTPAACYPLYPAMTGVLPAKGRLVDLRAFVFRHEPSMDPARMQIFRQREYVRLGTPEQAAAHRDQWMERGEKILRGLGLDITRVVANDPFFGEGRRLMAATQREQTLKYELVTPLTREDAPTAITSCNCHLDHFGVSFGIRTPDGRPAHTSCIGFGLERVALALFKTHGLRSADWPAPVRVGLGL